MNVLWISELWRKNFNQHLQHSTHMWITVTIIKLMTTAVSSTIFIN